MNRFLKFATLVLVLCIAAGSALAQEPATQLANLAAGAGDITGQTLNWAGFSELVLIPGSELFNVKSASTFLSIGFIAPSTVDVGNMVLYVTARNTTTVTGTKKVTLGGLSNPSINLASTAVCPVQPVSLTNPCIIKLDAVKGALSPLDDYYFAIYLANDSNNQSVSPAGPPTSQGSLSGYFLTGDETRIKKKGTLPAGYAAAAPYFLLYVTNE